MTDAVLRAARGDEAETLVEIQAEASTAALAHIFPPELYPFPFEAIREQWQRALADAQARVLVAEIGGHAVGVAAVRPEWLEGLYVFPACWGTGVGPALHDRALELVAELGSARCHLWVLDGNGPARRFYERRGWRENGRTRVVPFPPNPLDVGYTLTPQTGRRLAPR